MEPPTRIKRRRVDQQSMQVSAVIAVLSAIAASAVPSPPQPEARLGIPAQDQVLTTKYCNENFKGWEHDAFEDEYMKEILSINGNPYKHVFTGYVTVYHTTITLECNGCSIFDSKQLSKTIWRKSEDHHCSYSHLADRKSDCACSLDYSYRFGA